MGNPRFRSAIFFTMLSLFSTAFLAACSPKDSDSPKNKFVSVSQAASDCEAKLRQQMEAKNLRLQSIPELAAEISDLSQRAAKANTTSYSVGKAQNEVIEIKVGHFILTETTKNSIEYAISKASGESKALLSLEIRSTSIQPKSSIDLVQGYQVDSSCVPHLTQTIEQKIQQIEKDRYQVDTTNFYMDGQTQRESHQYPLPANEVLMNLLPTVDDLEKLPSRGNAYVPKVGIVQFSTRETGVSNVKEFGVDLSLKTKMMDLSYEGKLILQISYSQDSQVGVAVSEVAKRQTWEIPKALWKKTVLGESQDFNNQVRIEFPQDYLISHSSIQLVTKTPPSYDHFSAYWGITAQDTDSKTGLTTLSLAENQAAKAVGNLAPEDLLSNETIQTQLPEIQEIAKSIAAKSSDRRARIQGILNYLADHYTYDYEMLQNNVIRPLTTKEALERRKGVCQHYAVIFVSLARALNIPSRIVAGYYIGKSPAVSHAWNEVEVEPKIWQVIEPQSRTALDKMYTRFYLPVSRGAFLEDQKRSWAEYFKDVLTTDYILRPAL
jgi:hypothetical protein